MILRHLSVERFRNVVQVDLDLPEGITLFWGRNAQGKTNLLEAVHYLATGRSFRTRVDRECLPWKCEAGTVARIEGRVEGLQCVHNLAVSLTDRAKFAWSDAKALGRLGDLLGRLRVVLFTPDDIEITSGSPSARRRFLDMALSQMNPLYLRSLQSYTEALHQRNAALRSSDSWFAKTGSKKSLDPWADILVEHGVEVGLLRREALVQLSSFLSALYKEIAPTDRPLSLEYRSGVDLRSNDSREQALERFRNRLFDLAENERARGQTLVGPHRDDFIFKIGEREVRSYGSQGQRRSVALALRLAELRWMIDQTGEKPVLLVDDIGAELDCDRQERLLSLFGAEVQTLATTAGAPEHLGRRIGADCALEVCEGMVLRKEEKSEEMC